MKIDRLIGILSILLQEEKIKKMLMNPEIIQSKDYLRKKNRF